MLFKKHLFCFAVLKWVLWEWVLCQWWERAKLNCKKSWQLNYCTRQLILNKKPLLIILNVVCKIMETVSAAHLDWLRGLASGQECNKKGAKVLCVYLAAE